MTKEERKKRHTLHAKATRNNVPRDKRMKAFTTELVVAKTLATGDLKNGVFLVKDGVTYELGLATK